MGTNSIKNGAWIGIVIDSDDEIVAYTELNSSGEISRSAMDGTDSVVIDGVRVQISDDVMVYNDSTDTWISLTLAMTTTDTFEFLYDQDLGAGGKVRVIVIDP